jgi:hypothetical protein
MKLLKELVNKVFKIIPHKIRSVLAYEIHDTNKNFQYLEDKRESSRNKGKKEYDCFVQK